MITKIGYQLKKTQDIDIFAEDDKSFMSHIRDSEEHYNKIFKYKDEDEEEAVDNTKIKSDDNVPNESTTQKIEPKKEEKVTSDPVEEGMGSEQTQVKDEVNLEAQDKDKQTKANNLLGNFKNDNPTPKKHKTLFSRLAEWNKESEFTLLLKTIAGELDLVGKMFISHSEVHIKIYRMMMFGIYSFLFVIICFALLCVCCGNYNSCAAMIFAYYSYVSSIFVVLFYFFVLFYEFMMYEMVVKTMRTKNIILIGVMMAYGIVFMSWTGKLVDCYIYHDFIDMKNKENKEVKA
jgi:hypothetical protein